MVINPFEMNIGTTFYDEGAKERIYTSVVLCQIFLEKT